MMSLFSVVLGASCGGGPTGASGASQPGASSASAGTGNAAAVEPAPAAQCPPKVSAAAVAQGAACFDAAVLGAYVAWACGDLVVAKGWVRDPLADVTIGGRTKTLACYRAP